MALGLLDWCILAGSLIFFMAMAWVTKRYTHSVADFLAANRCGGRYMLGVAEGVATLGAISIIAQFEVFYQAGFSASWWLMMTEPVFLVVALTGWVYYRFRQTRCFTLAQFFEVRYSKRFRIFAGILGFLAGIINFGIFPAVGGRFFVYFVGLPQTVSLGGLDVPTFAIIMFLLLAFSLYFIFIGGQISVMVTDFFQGVLMYVGFAIILVYLLIFFDWSNIVDALQQAPAGESLINPFRSGKEEEFNVWFYIIMVFYMFYSCLAWQGRGSYNSSAKNAHEAKMGKVIGAWRTIVIGMVLVYLPICAYAVMNHPVHAEIAAQARETISTIDNSYLQEQMTTPVVLSKILPTGLLGLLSAMMLAAFISTHDTYLHSWGSIFIQDIVLPFRKKPLDSKVHMRLLKISILGVAVFIFLFSYFFVQRINILMFFAVTGAIFIGGVGAAIIGGLYWKKGSTAAAWSAVLVGSFIATFGVIVNHLWPAWYDKDFPIHGQYFQAISMGTAVLVYVVVSLLGKGEDFNMDRLLHRGKYAIEGESSEGEKLMPKKGFAALITRDFTRKDKLIYGIMLGWVVGWTIVFLAGTGYSLFVDDIPDKVWAGFWHFKVWLACIVSALTAVWFSIGGIIDVKNMFKILASKRRNYLDSGMVVDHQNLGEQELTHADETDENETKEQSGE